MIHQPGRESDEDDMHCVRQGSQSGSCDFRELSRAREMFLLRSHDGSQNRAGHGGHGDATWWKGGLYEKNPTDQRICGLILKKEMCNEGRSPSQTEKGTAFEGCFHTHEASVQKRSET